MIKKFVLALTDTPQTQMKLFDPLNFQVQFCSTLFSIVDEQNLSLKSDYALNSYPPHSPFFCHYSLSRVVSVLYFVFWCHQQLKNSGWKPTHLTSVFSLRTSILSLPDGTTLMPFTDVNMDVTDVR
jgi:hypothetical protein